MKTFRILLKNELKMSLRGMDMLIFAVIMPIIVLIILGVVFGQQLFGSIFWSIVQHSNLCRWSDGVAVGDF